MRRSGKRSALSSVAGILPVALAIGFVLWVLWRRGSAGRPELVAAPQPNASRTEEAGLPSPAPQRLTPVHWEPPSRSTDPLAPSPAPSTASSPAPSAASSPSLGSAEDAPESRARGRIEDLLERARLEDEGAA
jgi:hypothetical protein